ncbi:amidohydrolase family protein, partial [Bordetella pertussis]
MTMYADLVLHGGSIATLDDKLEQAQAVAIAAGRIIAVGSDAHCLALAGPGTRRIGLGGACVMPGINDSHCHPDGQAVKAGRWDDVSQVATQQALLARIADFHRRMPAGAWYLGFRFDDTHSGGYPARQALEQAAPGRPVFLLRRDAQVGLASAPALAALLA